MVQPINYGAMLTQPMAQGFQTGLQLGRAIRGNRLEDQAIQQQQQQLQQQQALRQQAAELYSSGTPDQIAQFSIQNPDIGKTISDQLQFKSDQTKANMMQSMQGILANPENTEQILMDRIKTVQDAGGDPSQTVAELQRFRQNPEGYTEGVERAYAMMDPTGYQAYRDAGVSAPQYTNVQFDEAGTPYGINKATGQYEPVAGGFQRAKPTPQTVVNVGEKQALTAEQKALAEQRVRRYGTITEAADAATQEIDSINQIRSIDLDTGFGTEFKSNAARVINALGGDGDSLMNVNVTDVDKFNSVAERQVLNVMATQKGPQTDQDALRIKKTVAGTENTKEANAFILDSMEALSNRKIEQQEFWDSYLENNDGSLKGVQSAWNQYKKNTPMVSDVIKNPATGKPMFYYQFREAFRAKGYPDEDIIESWRNLTGGK